MKVSVVVCTYSMERYDDFAEAVESVLAQTYDPIEVVLVVDGNPEVYARAVDEFGGREAVTVHDNDENRGVSYSRTKGAELATGEVVAFIDDDAVPEEEWAAELVAAYEEHDAVAVGGRMDGEWLAGRPWFLPTEFDWLVGVTHPGFGVDGEEVRNTFESNLSFRRDVFLELGGFDEELGPDADSYSHSEGAEIGVRLRREYDRGVVYNADAVVRHKVFEHRTQLPWLLSRAFEQGVSKRRMSDTAGDSTGEESAYLVDLLFDRAPRRINGLVRSPSLAAVVQLAMLFVFTAAVGIGYVYMMAVDGESDSRTETETEETPAKRSDDVLVVTHPLAPASESHVEALLDILSAITSVALVTANLSSDSSIREQYEVVELSNQGAGESILVAAVRFLRNQLRMCRVIAARDEDTVLFFGATAYLLPIAFSRAIGRTVVLEPRGNVPLTLRLQWEQRVPAPIARVLAGSVWALERAGYWLADAIITYTPSMAAELGLERFEEKLYPNGARYIDTERFSPQVPYEDREMVVGFLGRLDEEKNVRTLAAAAKELPAGITFRFIGDGDLREELERELVDEIEAGSVEFTGWVDHDEVPRELSELRLLVLPSAPTEGLPTVILEAMACGTPVLATPVAGVPDVVREGETGFLIEDLTADALADEITLILKGDETHPISSSGRELIDTEYSLDGAVRRYKTMLREVEC